MSLNPLLATLRTPNPSTPKVDRRRPGQPCPGVDACALCQAVITLRAHEAAVWQEAHERVEAQRCPCCGFLAGDNWDHAPDCEQARINRRETAEWKEAQRRGRPPGGWGVLR